MKKVALLFASLVLVFGVVVLIQFQRNPIIESISPRIGSPGDVLVIQGRHFGSASGSVFVAGERIIQRNMLEWSGSRISLRIPEGMTSGLVIVETPQGISNGVLYANRSLLPTPLGSTQQVPRTDLRISSREVRRGQEIEVLYSGITSLPLGSRLSWENADGFSVDPIIRQRSQGRITFIVPIQAQSGRLLFHDGDELVQSVQITVLPPRGLVSQTNELTEKIWTISYGIHGEFSLLANQHITEVTNQGLILPEPDRRRDLSQVRIPLLSVGPNQRPVHWDIQSFGQLTPNQVLNHTEYSRLLALYQLPTEVSQPLTWGITIEQQVRVTEIRNQFTENQVITSYLGLEEESRPWNTLESRILGIDEQTASAIRNLAQTLTLRQPNLLRRTRIVFDWVVNRSQPVFDPRSIPVMDLWSQVASTTQGNKLNSFSYAALTVGLLRASGIPARVIEGMLILDHQELVPHFWVEALLPEIGWIPLDPGFADGMFGTQSSRAANPLQYYFGSLDPYRITLGILGSPEPWFHPGHYNQPEVGIFVSPQRYTLPASTWNIQQVSWELPVLLSP
jgi:hypothetical protein